MRYSSRKLNNKKDITTTGNFWRQIACSFPIMIGNILFLGKKYLKSRHFFKPYPGGLGKKVHACSLHFSILNSKKLPKLFVYFILLLWNFQFQLHLFHSNVFILVKFCQVKVLLFLKFFYLNSLSRVLALDLFFLLFSCLLISFSNIYQKCFKNANSLVSIKRENTELLHFIFQSLALSFVFFANGFFLQLFQ